MVVRNTGNVPMSAVQVASDVLAGAGQDQDAPESSCIGDMTVLGADAPLLAADGYAIKQCTTTEAKVTSPASKLVNTATAFGLPMNPDDTAKPLNGDSKARVATNENVTRAQAATPAIALTTWVCPAGKSCAAADYKSATGSPARAEDGKACTDELGARSLAVGASAIVECSSTSVATAESPLLNTAQARGKDPYGQRIDSKPDAARVRVTPPTIGGRTLPSTGPTRNTKSSSNATLPLTGTTLGLAFLALTLIAGGTIGLRLRHHRPPRPSARHTISA